MLSLTKKQSIFRSSSSSNSSYDSSYDSSSITVCVGLNDYDVYNITQHCVVCNCKTKNYSIFECIHRPTIKNRCVYGYIGKKYYIKIFSCDEHYIIVKNKMKDRVLVCSDVSDFYNDCYRIFMN